MITYSTLCIMLPGAILLHVTEEFLFPGGFYEWYKKLVPPKNDKGINSGYSVWINTLMIGVCVLPLYFGETDRGMDIWFSVSAIAAINACFHIWGVLKLKIYFPGVVTGILLYLPLFAIGSYHLILIDHYSIVKAIAFLSLAVGYHIFSVIRQKNS